MAETAVEKIKLHTDPDRSIFASCSPNTARVFSGVCYVECAAPPEDGHTGRLVIDLDVDRGITDGGDTVALSVTPRLARHLAGQLLQAALDTETVAEWRQRWQQQRTR